ncbi:transcriptional regulator [Arthrobacter mangrovi]|uniref:Transcriptional regulator n=1 Tax=Arthrobacter mangrovi TaxID=2966350 RepID=A0ABQ5MUZ9_9MICC|nr:transcriptional regulator [Arthrobacter mangrovi]
MVIRLTEVLETELVKQAHPRIRAGKELVDAAQVRWVHSSEVLQIAPLLRGEELLLTGGSALLALKPAAQHDYVRSLAERHVTALAIETASLGRPLSADLVQAAEEAGLPLIEFQKVVPFVDVAEEVNRRIVSQQVTALQTADAVSQRIAERLASSGPALQPLLELITEALQIGVQLVDANGELLESAGELPDDSTPDYSEVDVVVGGIVAAKLRMHSRSGVDRDYLKTVGERLTNILALAMSQRHRPTLAQIADTALMRAIVAGAGPTQIRELCRTVGLDIGRPVFVLVFRSFGMAQLQGVTEQALRRCCPGVRTHMDGENLYALVPLRPNGTRSKRSELLEDLRAALADTPVAGVMGPTVTSPVQAPWSLTEAKLALSLGPATEFRGNIQDSENLVVERLGAHDLPGAVIERLTQEVLGELLAYDRRKGTSLLETLDQWLTFGCNSTEAAKSLFLERQTMHNRLTRAFELLGGDPRGSGKMAGLHFAVRLARTSLVPEIVE